MHGKIWDVFNVAPVHLLRQHFGNFRIQPFGFEVNGAHYRYLRVRAATVLGE